MKFTHLNKKHTWPKVKRKNINGVRHYVDEEYNIYHSVTRVVGDGKDFSEWHKRLSEQYDCSLEAGEAIGKYVMITAGTNGTRLHTYCEDYLNNKEPAFKDLLSKAHFENITEMLQPIDNIHGQEIQMFSKKMGLAGTVDCVADYDGVLSVIDFKTSTKKKPEEWIESYFLQATCYALMWEENTGQKIDQIVILMTGADMTQTIFKKDKAQYVDRLYKVIDNFKSNNTN